MDTLKIQQTKNNPVELQRLLIASLAKLTDFKQQLISCRDSLFDQVTDVKTDRNISILYGKLEAYNEMLWFVQDFKQEPPNNL